MQLLLDTHLLLWVAREPKRLSAEAVYLIDAYSSQLYFSALSIWEVAIKTSRGKADFQVDAAALRSGLIHSGFGEVVITGPQAAGVAALPLVHLDPFDRLLVAQARYEGMTLLTSDRKVARYGASVRLV